MNGRRILSWTVVLLLNACASGTGEQATQAIKAQQDAVTLKSLEHRTVTVVPSEVQTDRPDEIKKRYEAFLKDAEQGPLRAQAMKRLADLQMKDEETYSANQEEIAVSPAKPGSAPASPKSPRIDPARPTRLSKPADAVKLYEELLKSYPTDPNREDILYQLAGAYEQKGEMEKTLVTLEQLVQAFPISKYLAEAYFRRGEILFSLRKYAHAAEEYKKAIVFGNKNIFYEKSMSKYGWCLYQQDRYDNALLVFFDLLDLKLPSEQLYRAYADQEPSFNRGDREIIDDTFRVVSLALFYGKKDDAQPHFPSDRRDRVYAAFVYQHLGDLYLERERFTDAANIYDLFVSRYPNHLQAPYFHLKIIKAYQEHQFTKELLIASKEDFVRRYHVSAEFWLHNVNPVAMGRIRPHLETILEELARHYHALAQKSKLPAAYMKAIPWYQLYVKSFKDSIKAPQLNFLMAEALFEANLFKEAAAEYENTAYQYLPHKQAVEAGYAAILSYDKLEAASGGDNQKDYWNRRGIDSAIRFSDRFPQDRRVPGVLTKVAQSLYKIKERDKAVHIAKRILTLNPPVADTFQRHAWQIVAHAAFDQENFKDAESGYLQVLRLTAKENPEYKENQDQLAASIYKQGEVLRSQKDERGALLHFHRAMQTVPTSVIAITAQYDVGVSYLVLGDFAQAAHVLASFRQKYPQHPLSAQITDKIITAYMKSKQFDRAATEFAYLAKIKPDSNDRRAALMKAAELYGEAKQGQKVMEIYLEYVAAFPRPVEDAMEIMQKLALIYQHQGQQASLFRWWQELVKADANAGGERTDRTRFLAAYASLNLVQPSLESYQQVQLNHPLKQSVKKKKDKMQEVLKAYTKAADYNIAEVTTASTYKIAQLYSDFGRSLLKSQRPKKLSKDELEQYDILLEEQAFPFEEKAIKIHETNVKRTHDGLYDTWIKRSFAALSQLVPGRYAKTERSENMIDVLR